MERVALGDREAFTPLFRALKPRVHVLCRALLRHEQDAEDAMQLAMEKIFSRASTYERGKSVTPWALAIAAWECRGFRQKRRRRREEELDQTTLTMLSGPDLDQDIVRAELSRAASAALETLSEQDREVLVATFWDEASIAGVTPATLRKRRERALDRMRVAFRRLYGLD
jgi:RNA polymerase sigma-70 factor (ECF subfamily)